MIRCPDCDTGAPAGSLFCSRCGASLAAGTSPTSLPTATSLPQERDATASRGSPARLDHGRFLPGTMLADRYRIVGLLGRGGMGEVYRCDDVKLGQAVALKFLPAPVERDVGRLARFTKEVSVARQISHTNVCRVYDLGEVDGHHFLSMEYVDGEDLATLLRRIGRLPRDKAVQIARELCAGLAAAHDLKILHRDLKPANIMIDGRGRARITDFGLAGLADEAGGADVSAGTPRYMAPEQLAGQAASVRSDLYALGLVLYELFTGKPAFDAESLPELKRLRSETTPTSPSRLVEGFDPAVERVILRCLEREPRDRPSSALAIAAALPGGNPLAAALAAGETPSPELVAEAGAVGGLAPPVALACVAAIAMAVTGILALAGGAQLTRIVAPEKAPEALADRARQTLRTLGVTGRPIDSAYGFTTNTSYLDYIADHDPSPSRWEVLKRPDPPLLHFWYRQSPRYLVPQRLDSFVSLSDPPSIVSGMSTVILDAQGRLRQFERVPPQKDEAQGPAPEPDWRPLFQASELDPSALKSARPVWFPAFYVDARAAWDGAYPAAPDIPIHVEAAAYRGVPVFFRIIAPWSRAERMQASPKGLASTISQGVILALLVVTLLVASLLARSNLRLGRGDRKGAFGLAAYLLVLLLCNAVLRIHHVPESSELSLLGLFLSETVAYFCLYWIFYIAVEPYLRRLWPQVLVSWVRLLNGRFRDPLIGRDVLIGLTTGALVTLADHCYFAAQSRFGLTPPNPASFFAWSEEAVCLGGIRGTLAQMCDVATAPTFACYLMVLLLILRLSLRKQALTVAAFLGVGLLVNGSSISTGNLALGIVYFLATAAVWTLMIFRYGLVAMSAMLISANLLSRFPMTFDASAWYFYATLLPLGALAVLTGFAFHTSLAGRPVFKDAMPAGTPSAPPR